MTTTDTPRTDEPSELNGLTNDHVVRALRIFGSEEMTKDGSLEHWINLGADRLEKAEAKTKNLETEYWFMEEALSKEIAALKEELNHKIIKAK